MLGKASKEINSLPELDGLCRRQTRGATGQDPKWETRLEVCCVMHLGTTVTQAEMRAATEAVNATVSVAKHGMFNLDGRVLDNPSNPTKSST